MKTIHTIIVLLIAFHLSAQRKAIQSESSTLAWTGKAAFSSYALTGSLNLKNGYISISNDMITELNIAVDMTSLNHENNTLKSHLRSKDFFEVETYKVATFKLKESSNLVNGKATITGYLTIKETTKLETFDITLDSDLSTLRFNIIVDRTTYGVTYNSPSFYEKLKEDAIADVFELKGQLSLK